MLIKDWIKHFEHVPRGVSLIRMDVWVADGQQCANRGTSYRKQYIVYCSHYNIQHKLNGMHPLHLFCMYTHIQRCFLKHQYILNIVFMNADVFKYAIDL